MRRILPLLGKYGGFDTWEEWQRDLEREGLYDPIRVGLEARREAAWAKLYGAIGAILSAAGIVVTCLCR